MVLVESNQIPTFKDIHIEMKKKNWRNSLISSLRNEKKNTFFSTKLPHPKWYFIHCFINEKKLFHTHLRWCGGKKALFDFEFGHPDNSVSWLIFCRRIIVAIFLLFTFVRILRWILRIQQNIPEKNSEKLTFLDSVKNIVF